MEEKDILKEEREEVEKLLEIKLLTPENADKQTELGMIESLGIFDADTVKLIENQLAIRYFMPEVIKILSVKEEYGHTYWQVLTDKGERSFTSPSGSSGAVVRKGNRVIIRDSEQNRYEIKDVTKLTAKELKKLDLYL